ncbi:MAG: hypothetical protein V4515_12490 [Chloroflexota bacterium]
MALARVMTLEAEPAFRVHPRLRYRSLAIYALLDWFWEQGATVVEGSIRARRRRDLDTGRFIGGWIVEANAIRYGQANGLGHWSSHRTVRCFDALQMQSYEP